MEKRPSSHKAPKLTPLNLGTAGFIVAWLVFACYGIAYLVSH
jgi:hypothetical protein